MGSGWNRDTLEQCLTNCYDNGGQVADFTLTIDDATDMPAVLMQLEHLKAQGRVTSFDRRGAQTDLGKDNVLYIYGYTTLP